MLKCIHKDIKVIKNKENLIKIKPQNLNKNLKNVLNNNKLYSRIIKIFSNQKKIINQNYKNQNKDIRINIDQKVLIKLKINIMGIQL